MRSHCEQHTDLAEAALDGCSDHGCCGNLAIAAETVLDLHRIDVVAAADVHLRAAPDETEVAVSPQPGEIAGVQPSVAVDRVPSARRVVPVPAHHRPAAQAHGADVVGAPTGHGCAELIDEHQLDAAVRPSDGVADHVGRIVEPGARRQRRLCARVADHDRAVELVADLGHQLGRDPCRFDAGDAQARHVGRCEVWMIEHHPVLGRHALGDRDSFIVDECERGGGRPRRGDDDRGDEVVEVVPHPGHRVDVRERERRQPPIAWLAEWFGPSRHRPQARMIEPGALWQSGRSPRPDDREWVRCAQPDTAAERVPAGEIRQRAVEDEPWGTSGRDVGDLGRAEPGVDARRDAAGAYDRLVGDGVVDTARQADADDVALGDPAFVDQPAGEGICSGSPFAERDPIAVSDERLTVTVGCDDGVEQVDDGGEVAGHGLHQRMPGAIRTSARLWQPCRIRDPARRSPIARRGTSATRVRRAGRRRGGRAR